MGGMDPGGCIWEGWRKQLREGAPEGWEDTYLLERIWKNEGTSETTTLEKRSGETSGKTLKRTLEGFATAQGLLSSGPGANRVFGSDSAGDAWGDWDVLPSQSAQLRVESTNMFCIFRYHKLLRPQSPRFRSTATFGDYPFGCSEATAVGVGPKRHH